MVIQNQYVNNQVLLDQTGLVLSHVMDLPAIGSRSCHTTGPTGTGPCFGGATLCVLRQDDLENHRDGDDVRLRVHHSRRGSGFGHVDGLDGIDRGSGRFRRSEPGGSAAPNC